MSEYLTRVRNIERNPEQRIAFNTMDSCVVIAGPGSGKTYLLTTKVARILFEHIPAPRGVACLTFSNLLVEQLKEDLSRLGLLNNPRLFVGTVHSFCLHEIIQRYGHLYNEIILPKPFRISSEEEQIDAVKRALLDQGINYKELLDVEWDDVVRYLNKYRRLNPYYHREDFQDNRWENEPALRILYQVNWALLADKYIDILLQNEASSVDFTQIEVIALRMIEQRHLVREMLQASYPWFAVDEYQDLGFPFHRMITTLLSKTDIKIFAIGDPDQCIYEELQGTSPRYVEKLKELVHSEEHSQPILLRHSYRCPPNLIKVSERILQDSKGYLSEKTGGICLCYQCKDFEEQMNLILEEILPSLLDSTDRQVSPGEIAILHPWRSKPEKPGLNRLAQVLDERGDDWAFTIDKDIVYNTRSSKVIEWLEQAGRWCLYGWRTGRPYFRYLVPFWIKLNTDPQSQSLVTARFQLEQKLFHTLWSLRHYETDGEMSFEDWIDVISRELDLKTLLNAYAMVAPDDVKEFKQIVENVQNGGRLSSWPLSRFAKGPDRIQLTTLHSSKGTQFEVVIIAGLDKIGFFHSDLSQQDRRLGYVAVTRAKQRLYLLFQGMPEIIKNLKQDLPEGCIFYERRSGAGDIAVWQSSLF